MASDEIVARDDFAEFLARKSNGPFKCTFCGHGEMAINVAAERAVEGVHPEPALFLLHDQRPTATGAHGVYSISCTNCGNTIFFHMNQVQIWRDAKRAAEQNG